MFTEITVVLSAADGQKIHPVSIIKLSRNSNEVTAGEPLSEIQLANLNQIFEKLTVGKLISKYGKNLPVLIPELFQLTFYLPQQMILEVLKPSIGLFF